MTVLLKLLTTAVPVIIIIGLLVKYWGEPKTLSRFEALLLQGAFVLLILGALVVWSR